MRCSNALETLGSSVYSTLILERMGRIKLDQLIYVPFTGNDGPPTNTTVAAEAAIIVPVQEKARLWNTPVMYCGGFPNTVQGWSSTNDKYRRYCNRFSQGQNRMTRSYIDPDPVFWDGNRAFKPGVSDDDAHPNEVSSGQFAVNYAYLALRKALVGY